MATEKGKVDAMRERAEKKLAQEVDSFNGDKASLRAIQQRLDRKVRSSLSTTLAPDAKLAAIVGAKPLPRSELTRKIWAYIRKNGLRDKKKKSQINADDILRPVLNGKKHVTTLELTKFVVAHTR